MRFIFALVVVNVCFFVTLTIVLHYRFKFDTVTFAFFYAVSLCFSRDPTRTLLSPVHRSANATMRIIEATKVHGLATSVSSQRCPAAHFLQSPNRDIILSTRESYYTSYSCRRPKSSLLVCYLYWEPLEETGACPACGRNEQWAAVWNSNECTFHLHIKQFFVHSMPQCQKTRYVNICFSGHPCRWLACSYVR